MVPVEFLSTSGAVEECFYTVLHNLHPVRGLVVSEMIVRSWICKDDWKKKAENMKIFERFQGFNAFKEGNILPEHVKEQTFSEIKAQPVCILQSWQLF